MSQSAPKLVIGLLLALLAVQSIPAQTRVEAKRTPEKPQWESYPTRRLADLADFHPGQPIPLTKFGGRADRTEKGTGYFYVKQVGERWWLVDPEGGLFLNTAVVAMNPESRFGSEESFRRLFGNKTAWAENAVALLRRYDFNGIGAFSDTVTLRGAKEPMPYTISLRLVADFGKKLGLTHAQPGHTGFAGDCIPALHPDFPAYCEKACRQLAKNKNDAWLVGYFSDNELPGTLKMLDNTLSFSETSSELEPLRRTAWEWFSLRKGAGATVSGITDADRAAFLGYVYTAYFRITTQAIRKNDPNHLCLGSRLHEPVREKAEVWKAAGRYLDAIAMNYYFMWTPRASDLANWYKWSGKPCMITEFYVKGADTPYPNKTGAGWVVKTQGDRGLFYQNYTLALLESKTCVGWHWFKYMDNDPDNTASDASNRDANKGIVTIHYETYPPLLDQMKPINQNLYPLADYFDQPHH